MNVMSPKTEQGVTLNKSTALRIRPIEEDASDTNHFRRSHNSQASEKINGKEKLSEESNEEDVCI